MRVLTRWDQELSAELDHEVFHDLALWHLVAISDDDWIRPVLQAFIAGDYHPLIDTACDYSRLSLDDSRNYRQAQAFFSKREDLELGYDKLGTARDKFLESEVLCRQTNEIFRLRASGRFQLPTRVERVLWHASRKISSILGEIPKLADLTYRFGPGATTQIPKRMASARAKLGTNPACSVELFPTAHLVLAEMPLWEECLLDTFSDGDAIPLELHHGKVAFVPKSAKEYRTIIVEPSLNTMCQAGIGSLMADQLRCCGVDIRDQTRNQRLARKGSIDGSLATVDLSSASDTIATELVYDLLGLDWASFLGRFRTGTVLLEGQPLRLEKFSSMGNGFTFPLETLIFYALAYGSALEAGCATGDVSAYGDDIIIPVEAYPLLCDVFTSCGFKVNKQKSFAHGPFRESCGVDYYQGIDIRPVYQKTVPRALDLFRFHNAYYRNYGLRVCEHILTYLDPSIRLYGPDGYGDGHLLGEWVPVRKKRHASNGFGGYVFDTFTFKSRRSFIAYACDRVLPAYSVYLSEGVNDRTGLRGCDATYGKARGSDRESQLSVGVPGISGFNRISIYTFER